MHERFFQPDADVKVFVVPENRGAGIVDGRLAGNEIDVTRRPGRMLPRGFFEVAIDLQRFADVVGGVAGDFILGAGELPFSGTC